MKRLLYLFLLWLPFVPTTAQDIRTSRNTSYYTYVYSLTNQQADKIYQKTTSKVDSSYFNQPIDSFCTGKVYPRNLPTGHYLYLYTDKNQLKLEIKPVNNCDITILNNNRDLSIMVHDFTGNIVPNATLLLNNKDISFNPVLQTYFRPRTNRKGLLKVRYQGHTNYFQLNADNHYSKFKIAFNQAAYHTPAKWVLIPVKLVIDVPYHTYQLFRHGRFIGLYYYLFKPFRDPIKSIIYGQPQGYIRGIKRIFHPQNQPYKGYFIYNKPKYLPNDTVFFKAYMTDKKNRPLKDSLEVKMNIGENKTLGWIKPYRPGGYKFQFVANKSLGLKLDNDYYISLQNKKKRNCMTGNFRYEEYELKSTKYDFRAAKETCHYADKVSFYCKGTDENDLPIPDARIEIILLQQNILDYHSNRVFVPDTLWVHKQTLDPLGESKIIVPDSIFPAASLNIKAEAKFLNSNNELQTRTINIVKDNIQKEIIIKTQNDSISIYYHHNGIPESKNAKLSITGSTQNKEIKLPYKTKINPFAESYSVTTIDSIHKSLTLSSESAEVQCYTRRTEDSVWISIRNPRNLPLTYSIFRKNKPIFRGTSSNTEFSCKNTFAGNYSASIQYIWGGQAENKEYTIPFQDKQLNITVIQPSVIYPGQKTRISLSVTDANGKPVPDADITALSCTKKFNRVQIPKLSYNGKNYPGRTLFNNFNENNLFPQLTENRLLDYKHWNTLLSLDTIEQYKFLFPKDGYFHTAFNRNDTNFAEVSPYMVDSIGNLMPVNILYIDNDPVYYSITNNQTPYVFKVNNGWHSIKIRTPRNETVLNRIYLKKGTKTIICINPFIPNPNIQTRITSRWYTRQEQYLIYNSVFEVRNTFNRSFAYLNQGANYEILKKTSPYDNTVFIVGPYKPYNFNFIKHKSVNTTTIFEPGFQYEFFPNLVKMRTWNILPNIEKNYTDDNLPNTTFNDSVYTYQNIQALLTRFIQNTQAEKSVYPNPERTLHGSGMLKIKYVPIHFDPDLQAKNILVFSTSDRHFIRIYPGNETTIHDLNPGYYRIETILFNNQLIVTDSIEIKPFGTNYCKFTDANKKLKSAFTDSINTILQQRLFYEPGLKYVMDPEGERNQIMHLAQQSRNVYYDGGQTIHGKIIDAKTNEGLPGVTIVIDATMQGIITDLNGEFDLSVPQGKYSITISYIGYATEKLTFTKGADIQIALTPDIQKLEEVVVIGYGTHSKSCLSGSVSTVVTESLMGRMAGVSIEGSSGIQIRGISSINANNPSFMVVNGIPLEGNISDLNPEDIESMTILKDATATALYGSRAVNGVVLITTKKKTGNALVQELLLNKEYMNGVAQSKSLRNHFSDGAFWKPDLTTDKNGVASFDVTFPDDVTSWKTWYLAMGKKGASGQTEAEIKSFKPILSSLAIPRFLIAGDQANIIGKALNYTDDSISIQSSFEVNDSITYQKNGKIRASRIDTLILTATNKDSIKLQYQIKKTDGYSDGEQRYIPVFPIGTTETKGSFYNLESDSTIALNFDKSLGKVTLHAESNIIRVLLEEMEQLRNYQHYCNEQLSSKLKCFLWERKIYSLMKKKFTYDSSIRDIIKLLEERRNMDNLWGWWQNGPTQWWITLHATEALNMAQSQGFTTNTHFNDIPPFLYANFNKMYNRDQIRAVKLLKIIDTVPNYQTLIDSIKIIATDTAGRYELWELKQSCRIQFPLDSLKKEQKTTQFGNYYWGTEGYSLFDDAISATLVAYRILRTENHHSRELSKIRNYLLERKGSAHWQNTWETSRILETILPDLISNNELNLKPELQFTGAFNQKVDSFPYSKELKPGETIFLSKKSKAPVYFTAYQQFFNPQPVKISKDFIVTSQFANNDSVLKAGQPIKLIVHVTVKKASEYVLIDIPIPAGCTYQDKNNFVWGEDYREYFKEKVSIYCSRLGQRNYSFEVNLLPRYNGVYHLNPAKAELMYFPVFYGRERIKTIRIN